MSQVILRVKNKKYISEEDLALFRRYTKIFPRDESLFDPTKTCLAFGIECRAGWRPLIEETCRRLSELKGVEVIQIKEKFGELRFYVKGPEEAYTIASNAEMASRVICENCGASKDPGSTVVKGHRYGFCEACLKKVLENDDKRHM